MSWSQTQDVWQKLLTNTILKVEIFSLRRLFSCLTAHVMCKKKARVENRYSMCTVYKLWATTADICSAKHHNHTSAYLPSAVSHLLLHHTRGQVCHHSWLWHGTMWECACVCAFVGGIFTVVVILDRPVLQARWMWWQGRTPLMSY